MKRVATIVLSTALGAGGLLLGLGASPAQAACYTTEVVILQEVTVVTVCGTDYQTDACIDRIVDHQQPGCLGAIHITCNLPACPRP